MIKRIGERVIFQTKFFTIKDVDLVNDNGKSLTYQIIEKGQSALIVPIMDDQLILVREYFPAIDKYQLGLPKGRIEKEQDPKYTANKELQEEIGYKAEKIDSLGILTMSPGYIKHDTYIFLARELVESKLAGDEIEELEIVKYPFSQFEALIKRGEITEARMIAALFMARDFLKK